MILWLVLGVWLWSTPPVLSKNDLLGKIDPTQDTRFVKPDNQYTLGSARSQYIQKETYAAFIKMAEAAKKDGVTLVIVSATRTFAMQKTIWEGKWEKEKAIVNPVARAKKILLYSSMPGTSRHHWGTDIDLNALNNAYFMSGEGKKVFDWLHQHADTFGFCQTYTSKEGGTRTGYEEEKWHWSYMPLSRMYLQEYKAKIKAEDIQGFLGDHVVGQLPILTEFVGGIACL